MKSGLPRHCIGLILYASGQTVSICSTSFCVIVRFLDCAMASASSLNGFGAFLYALYLIADSIMSKAYTRCSFS